MAETTADKKSTATDIAARLKRVEEKSNAGANILSPKQALLDMSATQARHPDKHIRWGSLRNPDKMLSRKMEGYDVLSDADGGRRLGDDSVLMAIPREKYEARVKAQEKLNKDRLKQHKTEMQSIAESMVRQLRDNHGIDISIDRLLVSEES